MHPHQLPHGCLIGRRQPERLPRRNKKTSNRSHHPHPRTRVSVCVVLFGAGEKHPPCSQHGYITGCVRNDAEHRVQPKHLVAQGRNAYRVRFFGVHSLPSLKENTVRRFSCKGNRASLISVYMDSFANPSIIHVLHLPAFVINLALQSV